MGVLGILKNFGKKTLFYAGPYSEPTEKEHYKEIFSLLHIKTHTLAEKEFFCGHTLIEIGEKKEAKKLAIKNFETLQKENIGTILTSSAQSYHLLKNIYPTFIKEWNIEIKHIIPYLLEKLEKQNIKWESETKETIVYNDPCYLTRYFGMYEEPRKLIERLGGNIVEMKRNKEEAICCGASGGVLYTYPEFSKEMAKRRLKEKPKEHEKILSPCSLCTQNFRSVHEETLDFSKFLLARLRGILL